MNIQLSISVIIYVFASLVFIIMRILQLVFRKSDAIYYNISVILNILISIGIGLTLLYCPLYVTCGPIHFYDFDAYILFRGLFMLSLIFIFIVYIINRIKKCNVAVEIRKRIFAIDFIYSCLFWQISWTIKKS
jgi:hypothetical protein